MYSDSDDSQLSQPHLFVKKKTQKISTAFETKQSEDVVDRKRLSAELINLDEMIETSAKGVPTISENQNNQPEKLLIKFSSNSSSESSKSSSGSISSDNDTSLSEMIEDEEEIRLTNKSQQTSPTLLELSTDTNFQKSIDWPAKKKNESIYDLKSIISSPEIAPFQSKYLRNWQQQQKLYFNQKQSCESLNTMFDNKINLNVDSIRVRKSEDYEIFFKKKQKYGIFNFEFDEELFYKVKKLFPQVSDERIRTFMYKYHNQEHDVIAATINSLSPKREKRRLKHQSAMDKVLGNYIQMHRKIDFFDEEQKRLMADDEQEDGRNYAKVEIKIRYLKLLYPKADVLDLFYYLHNCDMKANNVAKKLEELGFERKALSESEESLISSLHFKDLMPESKLDFSQQQNLIIALKKEFQSIDNYLVELALKITKFNVDEARKLLDTVGINQHKNLKTYKFEWMLDKSKYIYKTSRGTQTNHRDYIDYGETYKQKRKKNIHRTNCKSTWTKEDKIIKSIVKNIAKGSDKSNIKGPTKKERIKLKAKGACLKNHEGSKPYNVRGNDLNNVKGTDAMNFSKAKSFAKGPNSSNCIGSFKSRPKNWLYDDELYNKSDDEQNYLIEMNDLLPIGNMFESFNYISNYFDY